MLLNHDVTASGWRGTGGGGGRARFGAAAGWEGGTVPMSRFRGFMAKGFRLIWGRMAELR